MNFEKDEDFVLKSGAIPQVAIEKKYDGIVLVTFCSGDKVKIFTDSGKWVESSLPDLVDEVPKIRDRVKNFCLIGEMEYWVGGKHRPREEMAALLHKKEVITRKTITYNVFDCLYYDRDIHKLTKRERREFLEKFAFPQSTMGVPSESLILNLTPSLYCETLKEAESALQKCLKAPGSEGAMIKLLDTASSGYSMSGMTSGVFKQKKFAEVHCLVGQVNSTKVGPDTFNYELYLRFRPSDKVDPKRVKEIKGKEYVYVGRSYNTNIKAQIGTVLTMKFHTMNLYHDDESGFNRLHLYEPIVVEIWVEKKEPDYFSIAIKIGQTVNLLIEKAFTKAMDLLWRVPPEEMKNWVPGYRRSAEFDSGVLKMETVPDELRKGRFVWFVTDEPEIDVEKMNKQLSIEKMKHPFPKLTNKKVSDLEEGEGTYPRKGGRLRGVSVGRDEDGYYVFTHRSRSKSYPSVKDIPDRVVQQVESTG